MILLHPDHLIFETSDGEAIPCSAELVTIELMGDAAASLNADVVREAAAAVVHYFRNELGREHVSVAEFSAALEKVLAGFGYSVSSAGYKTGDRRVAIVDLKQLVPGEGFELGFYGRVREEMKERLTDDPNILRLEGLRPCVKALAGARRWSDRCQTLSDSIVEYLRECFSKESRDGCELVVQ